MKLSEVIHNTSNNSNGLVRHEGTILHTDVGVSALFMFVKKKSDLDPEEVLGRGFPLRSG